MSQKNVSSGDTAHAVVRALKTCATPERAKTNAWFFKTGQGQYGEGDRFMGVTVPDTRKVAKQFRDLPLNEVVALLASPVHEVRLVGLLVIVSRYELLIKKSNMAHANRDEVSMRSSKREMSEVVRFYLAHLDRVNNWDLVDLSAPQILGAQYLAFGGEQKLYTLAKSRDLWQCRVAIVATYTFIRAGIFTHTLAIAESLLTDKRDLIHKATGWMLREVGKRDWQVLEVFLKNHAHHMPRTCLRYAIEKFGEAERKKWLTWKQD